MSKTLKELQEEARLRFDSLDLTIEDIKNFETVLRNRLCNQDPIDVLREKSKTNHSLFKLYCIVSLTSQDSFVSDILSILKATSLYSVQADKLTLLLGKAPSLCFNYHDISGVLSAMNSLFSYYILREE